jgi:pyruvate/oxaloacetate carboxyltransferase
LRGGYGETPGPVNKELQKKALKGEQAITYRPGDLIPSKMDQLRKEIKGIVDVLPGFKFAQQPCETASNCRKAFPKG